MEKEILKKLTEVTPKLYTSLYFVYKNAEGIIKEVKIYFRPQPLNDFIVSEFLKDNSPADEYVQSEIYALNEFGAYERYVSDGRYD